MVHTKRLATPRVVQIPRKQAKFTVTPRSGPHNKEEAIPLLLIVRDYLKIANNADEAKKAIFSGKIKVNMKVRKDHKYPVGLMDIIEVPDSKISKILLLSPKGRLVLVDVKGAQSKAKLYRIKDKTLTRGGNVQLNFHDGSNLLLKVKDAAKSEEVSYKAKDSVLVDLSKKKIVEHIPYENGSMAFLTGGSHQGQFASIVEVTVTKSSRPNVVILKNDAGTIETIEDYVFMVGKEKSMIPEVTAQ